MFWEYECCFMQHCNGLFLRIINIYSYIIFCCKKNSCVAICNYWVVAIRSSYYG